MSVPRPMSVLLAAVVGSALAPVVAGAQGDSALMRLASLGEALRAQPAWTATYTQEYLPAGMSLGEVVSGRVWIAWPDRALFASGDPVDREMGMAGLDVRLVDHENRTCDDHALSAEEWERIPLVAVLEPQRASDRFQVGSAGARGLVLTPRTPGGVQEVTIEVGEDGLPAEVVVRDPQGATSTFTFAAWAPSEGAPGGAWLPAPPEGVDCVSDAQ
jgi:hypothetical protein